MESVEKELQEEDNEKTNLIIRAKKIQTEQKRSIRFKMSKDWFKRLNRE